MKTHEVASLLALTLVACGSDDGSGQPAVRSDSAGVEIVVHEAPDRELPWRFDPEWSIGGAGDDRLQAVELAPYHVGADRRGNLYVLDENAHGVIRLSEDGAVIDTLGREGSGPGELKYPLSLGVEPDGTVSVFDHGKGGLVRWSPDGRKVDFLQVDAPYWGPKLDFLDGEVLFVALQEEGDMSRQRLIVWSPDADRTVIPFARMPDSRADFPTCGFRGLPVAPIFAPELQWDAEGGLIVVNSSPSYVLGLYENGRQVRSLRRAIDPRMVDEAMALEEVGEGLPLPVANCTVPPDEVVRGRGYADTLPSVMGVTVSPGGDVWVLRGHVAGEPTTIDVFEQDGGYRGSLPRGTPFPVAFLEPTRLVALARDAMEVPRLVVYRIVRGDEAGP